MKKILMYVCMVFVIILCVGCGKNDEKTFSCDFVNTLDGNQYTIKTTIDVKNNKVENATAVIEYVDEEFAETMCGIYKVAEDSDNVDCNGKVITLKEYDKSIARSLNKDELTESDIVDYLTNIHYTCDQ